MDIDFIDIDICETMLMHKLTANDMIGLFEMVETFYAKFRHKLTANDRIGLYGMVESFYANLSDESRVIMKANIRNTAKLYDLRMNQMAGLDD